MQMPVRLCVCVCVCFTCQHGDERQHVVFWWAPVPSLGQQVALQHLVVELLDPGLTQNHKDSAALDQTHKLLLQKTHIEVYSVCSIFYCTKSANKSHFILFLMYLIFILYSIRNLGSGSSGLTLPLTETAMCSPGWGRVRAFAACSSRSSRVWGWAVERSTTPGRGRLRSSETDNSECRPTRSPESGSHLERGRDFSETPLYRQCSSCIFASLNNKKKTGDNKHNRKNMNTKMKHQHDAWSRAQHFFNAQYPKNVQ